MGRPRADAHRIDTKERILSAAEGAFAEHGHAARLGDIAAEAGIRRPSLLYHFGTKDGLYEAVITRAFVKLGASLRGTRDREGEFVVRFEAVTRAFVDFVATHPDVSRLVVREMLSEGGPGTAILMGNVAPLLDEIARWVETEGGEVVRADLPVRPALLQVVSDVLLAGAADAVRDALWSGLDADRTWMLCRTLFLKPGVT